MRKTYRLENDEIIIGQSLPVFIDNINIHLSEILIFKDGKIDCWGLCDFDTFVEKVKSGWVKTSIPKRTKVFAFPLGNLKVKEFYANKTNEDLILEVKDIIDQLNNKPTSSQICYDAFQNYRKNPTQENKEKLKTRYESIPSHNKMFVLGDMDVDDIPIRVIIYGEKEFDKSKKAKLQKQYINEVYLNQNSV